MKSRRVCFLSTVNLLALPALLAVSTLLWAGDDKKNTHSSPPPPRPSAPAPAHPTSQPSYHPAPPPSSVSHTPGGANTTANTTGAGNTGAANPGGYHPTPAGAMNPGAYHPNTTNATTTGGYHPNATTGPAGGTSPDGATGASPRSTSANPSTLGRSSTMPNSNANVHTVSVSKPVYHASSNEQAKSLPGGAHEYHNAQLNRTVRTDASGHITQVQTPHMTVSHVGGARTVVAGAPGARVVSYGGRRGWVEHQVPGRRGYYARTYVYGGRPYAVVYRQYYYRNYYYYRYVPAYYYGPRFYGWAVSPWYTPVSYYWGWNAYPWYGYYSGYFAPYPVYASPNLWLTDYLLAENLRLAYENQQAANAGAPPQDNVAANSTTTLTPEVKEAIAEEVKKQIAEEQAAAKNPSAPAPANDNAAPPALSQKFFVVSQNLEVAQNGQPCALTPGDIIQRRSKDVDASGNLNMEVVSSKNGDCAADSESTVQVQLTDLQEMHNQFRQHIDSGLKTLADNQAKGLPSAPDAEGRAVPDGTAAPDATAESTLVAQQDDSEKEEAQLAPAQN